MPAPKDLWRPKGPARPKVRAFDTAWERAEWLALMKFAGGERFESSPRKIKNVLGEITDREAVPTFAGREAIALAAGLGGLGPGDEVVCPSFTCPSSVRPLVASGCRPVFADIGRDLCVDPGSVREALSDRTKAILMVHMFGQAARARELADLCHERSLMLIDDAASAFGVIVDGVKLGTLGAMGIYSFNYAKIISSVGGGALILGPGVVDPDPLPPPPPRAVFGKTMQLVGRSLKGAGLETALTLRRSLRQGAERSQDKGAALPAGSKPPQPRGIAGIQAELALIQIGKADAMAGARKRNRSALIDSLADPEGISLPECPGPSANPYLPILVDRGHRYDLASHLAGRGYQSTWDYYPLHMQGMGEVRVGLPVTEDLWRRILLLPLGPSNSEERMAEMGRIVSSWARSQ